jgi:hypothetical protein
MKILFIQIVKMFINIYKKKKKFEGKISYIENVDPSMIISVDLYFDTPSIIYWILQGGNINN